MFVAFTEPGALRVPPTLPRHSAYWKKTGPCRWTVEVTGQSSQPQCAVWCLNRTKCTGFRVANGICFLQIHKMHDTMAAADDELCYVMAL